MATTAVVQFKSKVTNVQQMFKARKTQMERVLPKVITPERLITLAMAAIQNTPKLMECDQLSFVNAVVQAGRLGLEPDGLLGHAYLVPFKGKVVLVPGYKGLLKLARNSGQIATIQAHEVYEADAFRFHYGLDPVLEHTPTAEPNPGKVIAFYAVARLKDGSSQFEVMWARQVNEIRDSSQGYKAAKKYNSDTPWDTHYAEMGKKTVLRRLCKMLPSSVELQKAVALDEQADAGIDQPFDIDIDPETGEITGDKPSALDAIVASENAHKELPAQPAEQAQAPAPEPKARGKAAPRTEAKPLDNPNYAEGSDPDPFAGTGTDPFGS